MFTEFMRTRCINKSQHAANDNLPCLLSLFICICVYICIYIYLSLRKMALSQPFVNKVVLQKGNYFLILSWASISHVVKPSHLRSHALLHWRGHRHVRLVRRVESAATKLTAFLTKSTRVKHRMRKYVTNCIATLHALLSWCSSAAASKSGTISL